MKSHRRTYRVVPAAIGPVHSVVKVNGPYHGLWVTCVLYVVIVRSVQVQPDSVYGAVILDCMTPACAPTAPVHG